MTMKEVFYAELFIIYLPNPTFVSQTFETSSAHEGCIFSLF